MTEYTCGEGVFEGGGKFYYTNIIGRFTVLDSAAYGTVTLVIYEWHADQLFSLK